VSSWVDMSADEMRQYLKDLRTAYTLLEKLGSRQALTQRLHAVARAVAVVEKGEDFVRRGDPIGTHSQCKGTGRGQKDKVASELARHGMVTGYRLDSQEGI
jgi:hypothetical protein